MNSKYMPSDIPGYTFLSNTHDTEVLTGKKQTPISIQLDFSKRYNIPVDDILVLEMLEYPKYSVYIHDDHKQIAVNLSNTVKEHLAILKLLEDLD